MTDNTAEARTAVTPIAAEPKRQTPAVSATGGAMSSFTDPAVFDQLWRGAKALSGSQLVPRHFRSKPEDCFIALHIAHRLGADPLLVLQSLYIVHGSPGWSAKFVIAQANMSGAFRGRIKFRTEGTGKSLAVTAYATLAETGEEVAETVTMVMAEAEGWTENNKYKSLPELMLKYRAATFLVRLHAPEVMMGVPVVEETVDVASQQASAAKVQGATTGAGALKAALEQAGEDAGDPGVPDGVDPETGEVVAPEGGEGKDGELPF